jgi:hypothetical protein
MNPDLFPETQVCAHATWVFAVDQLDGDTYILRHMGEVSLVDTQMLKTFLAQLLIGVPRVLGGDDVAGA